MAKKQQTNPQTSARPIVVPRADNLRLPPGILDVRNMKKEAEIGWLSLGAGILDPVTFLESAAGAGFRGGDGS